MPAFLAWWRARGLGSNRARLEREMEEEMHFHQEMEAADLVARGFARESARRRATIAFGAEEKFKEEAREVMALTWLRDFRLDAAFALRSLRRSPGFTAVAVSALALGIGANATVFGIVDSDGFRELPIRDPERVVAVFAKQGDAPLQSTSYPNFEEVRASAASFSDAAAFTEQEVSVGTSRGLVVAWGVHVSDNYFTLQGVDAAHGRLIHSGDLRNPIAVISNDFWKREFGANPRVVGKVISINGSSFTIVGVAPADYHGTRLFTYDPSVWLPVGASARLIDSEEMLSQRGRGRFSVIARLGPDVSLARAETEVNAIARRIASRHQDLFGDLRFTLVRNSAPINPWLAPRERVTLAANLLILGVCLVLVVACANVANLLLARMTVRRHELSVRLALGASRARLARQLLTESLVLAALGALAAVPLAFIALKASVSLVPPVDFAPTMQPSLNGRVLVFTLGASVISAVAFGLAPLVQFGSHRLNPDEHSSTGLVGPTGARFRASLVVGQIAISVIALVAAGLFYRGLNAARSIDVGFDVRNALVFTLDATLNPGNHARDINELHDALQSRLASLPDVQSVALASSIPLDGNTLSVRAFSTDPSAPSNGVFADYFSVSENYFSTMRIRLISGRSFSGASTADAEGVVVNETLARRLWNGEPAVGRVISVGGKDGKILMVVGVARSEVSRRVGDRPRPILWRSIEHHPPSRFVAIVRARGDTAGLIARIQATVRSLDPQLPVIGLRTLSEQVAVTYSAAESGAFSAVMFGGLTVLLAAVGLFGALAYNVSQRTREIGLRQAIGASRWDIVRLVTSSGMRLTLLGMSIAFVAILFIPRKLSVLLYGVSPHDPVLIAIASGVFLLIAAIASIGPALKALRIEPVEALRAD